MKPSAVSRVFRLGLLGLPGSGKSTIARLLAERGCKILDADLMVRLAYEDDDVRAAVRARFGDGCFDAAGGVQRQQLAAIAFENERARRDLEAILHPWVRRKLAAEVAELEASPLAQPVAVYDVPLLAEGGLAEECDAFLFVEASRATRLERVAARGWDEEELARREAAQWTAERKREVAGARPLWTISNEGDLGAIRRALDAIDFQATESKERCQR